MNKKLLGILALYTLAIVSPSTADAVTVTLTGTLSGANENPAVISPGGGSATVIVDTTANTMTVMVAFFGLTTPDTAAHIHCCVAPPGNAGVATTIPAFVGFPLGVTSGTYTQTLDMLNIANYNIAFVNANGATTASAEAVLFAAMLAGDTYLNIHTQQNPGGEIRAFLEPTPLPAALPLFVTGLCALGLLGWRRKKNAAAQAA